MKKQPFIPLTNNYVHALMKQKKTKTDCLRGVSVFVLIVLKFSEAIKALGLLLGLAWFHQFFRVWTP